jgi:hypothetical protein
MCPECPTTGQLDTGYLGFPPSSSTKRFQDAKLLLQAAHAATLILICQNQTSGLEVNQNTSLNDSFQH